jgi:hypothetical protein
MTLGAHPELLAGYRNQRLRRRHLDVESITVDWAVSAQRSNHGIANIEEKQPNAWSPTGCGQVVCLAP